MPITTTFRFGDVVLVPFPFTDQTSSKKRPAVVVSSHAYHEQRPDLIIMAITSRIGGRLGAGDTPITYWQDAGLLKPSLIKPVVATVERNLVIKRLGTLREEDCLVLDHVIDVAIGRAKTKDPVRAQQGRSPAYAPARSKHPKRSR